MEKARIGLIGLGPRGMSLLRYCMLTSPLYDVAAVCDLIPERIEEAKKAVEESGRPRPDGYTDYFELLKRKDLQAVVVATYIEQHFPIAIAAMKEGKRVGMEVGGAYSLHQCWQLVDCAEETGMSIMPLENCCYGQRELMALNMMKLGVFGTVVHCAGGYQHDCRDLTLSGEPPLMLNSRGWRSKMTQNEDHYPTHDLGPICRVLDVNHGNRILTVASTASRTEGLRDYLLRHPEKCKEPDAANARFVMGDVISTVIKCVRGETIALTFETSLPRYYSRNFTVRGTRGLYEECTDSIFLDDQDNAFEGSGQWKSQWGNASKYEEKYDHPLWKEYQASGATGGHGGMDGLTMQRFAAAVAEGKPFDIDQYDAATWMGVSVLSSQSVAQGGMPMPMPDFTSGMWTMR